MSSSQRSISSSYGKYCEVSTVPSAEDNQPRGRWLSSAEGTLVVLCRWDAGCPLPRGRWLSSAEGTLVEHWVQDERYISFRVQGAQCSHCAVCTDESVSIVMYPDQREQPKAVLIERK